MIGRPPILYQPGETPPKTARFRLTFTDTGLCQYFCHKVWLLAAARKSITNGVAVKAEPLATRPPGRPKGSGSTSRANHEWVYYRLLALNAPEGLDVDWHHYTRDIHGKRGDPAYISYPGAQSRRLRAKDLIALLKTVKTPEDLLPTLFPDLQPLPASYFRSDEENYQLYLEELKKIEAEQKTP